jgi:cytochrome c551/c552
LLATYLLLCFLTGGALAANAEDAFQKDVLAVFQEACLKCHGGDVDNIRGDVDLRNIEQAADLQQRADLLERIIEAVEFDAMPPEDQPPLPQPTRQRLLNHLQQVLRQASAETQAWPRTPIRRMNRFQYNNAVHDLFELQVDVFALPERMLRDHNRYFQPATGKMPHELRAGSRPLGKSQLIDRRLAGVAPFPQDLRAEHGFDNRGDHFSLSPLLMESFLKLGRSIVESPDFTPATCGIWETFFAAPPEEPDEAFVRDRLKPFLRQAFRRPVSAATLERYTGFVMQRLQTGASFPGAMKTAAAATLASPRFLALWLNLWVES